MSAKVFQFLQGLLFCAGECRFRLLCFSQTTFQVAIQAIFAPFVVGYGILLDWWALQYKDKSLDVIAHCHHFKAPIIISAFEFYCTCVPFPTVMALTWLKSLNCEWLAK